MPRPQDDWWDWVVDVATIATAAGAMLAVIVAAFAAYLPYHRRPRLSLHEDVEREHSRVEIERDAASGAVVGRRPYLRLLVRNKPRKRAAQNARVVLDGYRRRGNDPTLIRLGSPFLSWPSVFGQGDDDSRIVVIFAGAERPCAFGRFYQARSQELGDGARTIQLGVGAEWHMHLELAGQYTISDGRDWLPPGEWMVRVVIGADDGDARAYNVHLSWDDDPNLSADEVLNFALDRLEVHMAD